MAMPAMAPWALAEPAPELEGYRDAMRRTRKQLEEERWRISNKSRAARVRERAHLAGRLETCS